MNKEELLKKYQKRVKFLRMNRFISILIAIFVLMIIVWSSIASLIAGILLIAISSAFQWYLILDNIADKYEDRLIDFEEMHNIKPKKK